jgi:hypothetical protein
MGSEIATCLARRINKTWLTSAAMILGGDAGSVTSDTRAKMDASGADVIDDELSEVRLVLKRLLPLAEAIDDASDDDVIRRARILQKRLAP